jgi:hypothetical protein
VEIDLAKVVFCSFQKHEKPYKKAQNGKSISLSCVWNRLIIGTTMNFILLAELESEVISLLTTNKYCHYDCKIDKNIQSNRTNNLLENWCKVYFTIAPKQLPFTNKNCCANN